MKFILNVYNIFSFIYGLLGNACLIMLILVLKLKEKGGKGELYPFPELSSVLSLT